MDRYSGDLKRAFIEDERRYEEKLLYAVDKIFESKTIRIIFISGASCAGKTPTTNRLSSILGSRGKKAETISLDDFYRRPEEVPCGEDGKPDFETIKSLDLDYLHFCLAGLAAGREVMIPRFDFALKSRSEIMRPLRLDEGEVCIIEGLHALNPEIGDKYIDKDSRFKIYLDAYTDKYENPRLLRRIVRDYYFRATSAEQTFDMWQSVLRGEKKYVFPFKDSADVIINTFFEYEPYVLRDEAIFILSKVPPESVYYKSATEIIAWLESLPSLPKEAIGEDSLFREFIR